MINSKIIHVALSCISLLVLATNSYADRVTNERELAILPAYCHGTQQIRSFTNLPKSEIDHYYKLYGANYNHLHHYCWALVSEFNADKIREKGPKNNKFNQALDDIEYVLNKNPPASFPPLPDIYSSRARILLRLGRTGEAVSDLLKVINLQPGYQRAYVQLSDHYLDLGHKDKAIAILEKGVENHESPTLLLRRLVRLGKPYTGTPGSAVAKTQTMEVPPIDQDSPAIAPPPAAEPVQQDSKTPEPAAPTNPANPYCRFCP
jgi:hypothetical protein